VPIILGTETLTLPGGAEVDVQIGLGLSVAGYRPAPSAVTFTTPGIISWTVPTGVTSITVEGVGPGGRGASYADYVSDSFWGGGGGAYARSVGVAVTPGESLTITISNPFTSGGSDETVVDVSRPSPFTQLLVAEGGFGYETGNGGSTFNCVYNDIAYDGGGGSRGNSGGGGGGGAGNAGAGGNASGVTGGTGGSGNPESGAGGDASNGFDGTRYGGGGGQPGSTYGNPNYRPYGGYGWVRISW
jgi:hypothetical protein